MISKDIHKIDNYLIRAGIGWLIFIALYGACTGGFTHMMFGCAGDGQKLYDVRTGNGVKMFTSSDTLEEVRAQHPRSRVTVITEDNLEPIYSDWNPIYLSAPWILLLAGYLVRRQENKVVAIWNVLERSREVNLNELSVNTGYDKDFLLKSLQIINRHSREPYHWDETNNIIYNAWSAGQVFYVESCVNCAASVGQQMRLSKLKPAKCPYCSHALISEAMIEEAKAEKQKTENPSGQANSFSFDGRVPGGSNLVSPEKPFNPFIFIALLIFASPLAIGYAIWKTGLLQRWKYESIRNPELHAGQAFLIEQIGKAVQKAASEAAKQESGKQNDSF